MTDLRLLIFALAARSKAASVHDADHWDNITHIPSYIHIYFDSLVKSHMEKCLTWFIWKDGS